MTYILSTYYLDENTVHFNSSTGTVFYFMDSSSNNVNVPSQHLYVKDNNNTYKLLPMGANTINLNDIFALPYSNDLTGDWNVYEKQTTTTIENVIANVQATDFDATNHTQEFRQNVEVPVNDGIRIKLSLTDFQSIYDTSNANSLKALINQNAADLARFYDEFFTSHADGSYSFYTPTIQALLETDGQINTLIHNQKSNIVTAVTAQFDTDDEPLQSTTGISIVIRCPINFDGNNTSTLYLQFLSVDSGNEGVESF